VTSQELFCAGFSFSLHRALKAIREHSASPPRTQNAVRKTEKSNGSLQNDELQDGSEAKQKKINEWNCCNKLRALVLICFSIIIVPVVQSELPPVVSLRKLGNPAEGASENFKARRDKAPNS